ncbi:Intraflagellar transport protein 43 [Thoreauomyces humboldtii]|nr:Intraflagellar transport protein 43 [Thoreauomyces humboldtii]
MSDANSSPVPRPSRRSTEKTSRIGSSDTGGRARPFSSAVDDVPVRAEPAPPSQPPGDKDARKSKPRRVRESEKGDGERPEKLQAARSGWDLGEAVGDGKERKSKARASDDDDDDEGMGNGVRKEKLKKHTTIGRGAGGGGGGVEEAVTIIIPDLEDVQDDEMLVTVAAAPAIKVNRFRTMHELDGELLASTGQLIEPPTSLAGIDVSLLVSMALNPPDQLAEPDVPWDWDVTFTEVTSNLNLTGVTA